jgi:DNA-binding response OmpR family regulator
MSDLLRPKHLVMLLEDEALIALALQSELEEQGYAVAGPFATCVSALDWLASNKPDLAILDTVLKDGPCRDVALELNAQYVPFVVYSGHREDRNTLPEFDDVAWVEKPAPPGAILAALDDLTTSTH